MSIIALHERLILDVRGVTSHNDAPPIAEGDIVILEIPKDLRPVWNLLEQVNSRHQELHDELDFGEMAANHDDQSTMHEHQMLHAMRDYLARYFGEKMSPLIDYEKFKEQLGRTWLQRSSELTELRYRFGMRQDYQLVLCPRSITVAELFSITHSLRDDLLIGYALDALCKQMASNIYAKSPTHKDLE